MPAFGQRKAMGQNMHVLGGRFCARSPGIRTLPVKLRGLGDIKFGSPRPLTTYSRRAGARAATATSSVTSRPPLALSCMPTWETESSLGVNARWELLGGLLRRTQRPLWPADQQNAFNCCGHFQKPPRGSLGPQETTKQYHTRKNTQRRSPPQVRGGPSTRRRACRALPTGWG